MDQGFLKTKTPHDLKYVQEIMNDFTFYISQLILNIFNGVTKNLGISNLDKIASKPPKKLQKGFLSGMKSIGKKIYGYVGRKIKKSPYDPFEVKGLNLYKKGKPLTNAEWVQFEKQVVDYLNPYLSGLGEEMAVKGFLLAMASNEMEQQGKTIQQYGKKSYEQVENQYFAGVVPDTFMSAEDRYKMDDEYKKNMSVAYNQVGEYISNISDKVSNSVREQILAGHRLDKNPGEIASDLYWAHVDKPELKEFTAEIVMRDWKRVAHTEFAMLHEKGKMAQSESQAQQSIKDPTKAVYKVFSGSGQCDFCDEHQGTIVRQVPANFGNKGTDSLKTLGIDDPYTDIAIWSGKSNYGRPQSQWWICAPAHPWCADSFSVINPEIQEYDKELGTVKLKTDKELERFIPTDFTEEIDSLRRKYREQQDILAKERADSLIREGKKKL